MRKWLVGAGIYFAVIGGVGAAIWYERYRKRKNPSGKDCTLDADCGEGRTCASGTCKCATDKGCPEGQACNGGECVKPGTCGISADCPHGWGCVGGECIQSGTPCSGDSVCPADWGCYSGKCKSGCSDNSDCQYPKPVCSDGQCIRN